MPAKPHIRLSEFIRVHMEKILQAWEDFAKTIEPAAFTMDATALRNHAYYMLLAIAEDLDRSQTRKEEIEKSEGRGKRGPDDTAAETHAIARLLSGYSIDQLASEYRALRSSVLRLWAAESKMGLKTSFDDIARFNEAIDQALAESLSRYSKLLNQSRNLFLAILGHDLRNPLNATITGAQILLQSADMEGRYRDIATRILNSGYRMNKLVDDLIDYTRTHLGSSLPIIPTHSNIANIAQTIIDEMRTSHQERDIALSVSGKLDGIWDKERIAQVISNLVGNAVQHGMPKEAITVEIYSVDDGVVMTINNKGPVIPEEKLWTIFEPMVRYVEPNAAHPERENSLGLGLYISREIVKAHGGTLGVNSYASGGTTFTLRLPHTALT